MRAINLAKKLLLLSAMCLGNSVSVYASIDDQTAYNEATEMLGKIRGFDERDALIKASAEFIDCFLYSGPDRLETFPDRTITAVNNFRHILMRAAPEAIVDGKIQTILNVTALHVFNMYISLNKFGTGASNNALVLCHYTVAYYLNTIFSRNDAFRPFCNQAGEILTPQEFADSNGRLSGMAYFRHWSKFLPDHRMPKSCCSIL